jgi:type III restriction enzyme
MANGERCTDPEVARLMVVANESYDDFASALQREIEDETSVSFPKKHIKNARNGRPVHLKRKAELHPKFKELWAKISRKTSFQVDFDTDTLVEKAAEFLRDQPAITAPKIRVEGAAITLDAEKGVTAQVIRTKNPITASDGYPIPDLLGHLANDVPLTRATLAKILIGSGRLGEATINPQRFIDQARASIQHALDDQMLHGIQYSPLDEGEAYAMSLLKEQVAHAYSDEPLKLDRSAYEEVAWESDVEKQFAEALNTLDGVEWFIKLPWWFQVDTPLGPYNPDWAIVLVDEAGKQTCYLVRETKGTDDLAKLRPDERLKIKYGKRHFDAIDVDYTWLTDATDLRIDHDRCAETP